MKLEDLFEDDKGKITPEKMVAYIQRYNDNKAKVTIDDSGVIQVLKGTVIIKPSIIKDHKLPVSFSEVQVFHATNCDLTSLEGFPSKVQERCTISKNPDLKSLVGGPKKVSGSYFCYENSLTSLEGIASEIGSSGSSVLLDIFDNKITSLKDIHKQIQKLDGNICLDFDKMEDSILGLLLIKGLRGFAMGGRNGVMTLRSADDFTRAKISKNAKAFLILMKYLGKGSEALFDCQEELINAGYPELASL